MSLELKKDKITINQIISDKNEKAKIEGDCIVPDIKPDILNIVSTNGVLNIYKKEVLDGKVRIEGCVNTFIMYEADNDGKRECRCINHVLDFSQIFIVENATKDMIEEGEISLNSIECKIVNERKLNISAIINFNVEVFSNSNIEYVNNVEIPDIQKLEDKMNINSIFGRGETRTITKETVKIDNVDVLSEILKADVAIENKEYKISYNKILTKADIKIKILYSTEDNRVNLVNAKYPIMGFIDMQNISESNICDTYFEVKNMIVKPNGEQDHSIDIEVETGIEVIAYEKKDINIIKDLYSPLKCLDYKKQNIKMIQNVQQFNTTFSINQKENINIGNEKIYDVDTIFTPNNVKALDNSVQINGNLKFNIISSKSEMNGIAVKTVEIPYDNTIECKGVKNGDNVRIDTEILSTDFSLLSGGIFEIKLDIKVCVSTRSNVTLDLINNVDENTNEETDDCNMVIYRAMPNDSLWSIAKKFKSTIDMIKEENELKEDIILPGQQLFIEKYMG